MSLNSGSCWDILEITSTTEKKLIKRAYHKLLRQYKPDEHPIEFKILYEAYQNALEWEDYDNWDEDEDIFSENQKEENNLSPKEIEEIETEEKLLDDYWERREIFEDKVDELTYNNNYPELFNQLESWKFLEDLDITSDLEFFNMASEYLFLATGTFDEKHEKVLLNAEVIQYFDKIFLWKSQWKELDMESTIFEYLDIKNDIVLRLEMDSKEKKFASAEERITAFSIDLAIPILLALVMNFEIFNRGFTFETLMIVGIYYIAIQVTFFCFLGLTSLGHFFMKLKVLEGSDQDTPTFTARSLRLVFTLVSIVSIIMVIQAPIENQIFFIPIGFNAIFWFTNKRLLQDYSATRIYSFKS